MLLRSRRYSVSSSLAIWHRQTPRPLWTGRFRVWVATAVGSSIASVPAPSIQHSAIVAAIDNLPPVPPTQVRAIDVPDDGGGAIEITWTLSTDDHPRLRGVGAASVLGAGGPVALYRDQAIDGYRIYREDLNTPHALLATLRPEAFRYVDSTVIDEVNYVYTASTLDGPHETQEATVSGSAGDRARTAFARDNLTAKTLQGWFDPSDRRTDLNDFFIFADNFGRTIPGTMAQTILMRSSLTIP
jgi:hypothetical protein